MSVAPVSGPLAFSFKNLLKKLAEKSGHPIVYTRNARTRARHNSKNSGYGAGPLWPHDFVHTFRPCCREFQTFQSYQRSDIGFIAMLVPTDL